MRSSCSRQSGAHQSTMHHAIMRSSVHHALGNHALIVVTKLALRWPWPPLHWPPPSSLSPCLPARCMPCTSPRWGSLKAAKLAWEVVAEAIAGNNADLVLVLVGEGSGAEGLGFGGIGWESMRAWCSCWWVRCRLEWGWG